MYIASHRAVELCAPADRCLGVHVDNSLATSGPLLHIRTEGVFEESVSVHFYQN